MAVKFLDMPPGNGVCDAYAGLLENINAGRSVAIVPVANREGKRGAYVFSAVRHGDELTAESSLRHCVRMVIEAREESVTPEQTPIPRDR